MGFSSPSQSGGLQRTAQGACREPAKKGEPPTRPQAECFHLQKLLGAQEFTRGEHERQCRARGTQKQEPGSQLKNLEVRGWLRPPWRPSEDRGRSERHPIECDGA